MCPVNETSFGIPLVFAIELYPVAHFDGRHAISQINVMCHHQSLPGSQLDDKSLVTTPIIVIAENSGHSALGLNLNVAFVLIECLG